MTGYNIADRVPDSVIIGGVAIYPADDAGHIVRTSRISRDIVDRYCDTLHGEDLLSALIRALARRLTAITGGETAQNINMLEMTRKLAIGEPIRETDPLISELLINQSTGNPV